MLPSSAIQILEQSANRLVIFGPPYYLLGLIFLAAGVFDLATGVPLDVRTSRRLALVVTLVLGGAGFAAALVCLAPRSYIMLSRPDGQIKIQRRYFGMVASDRHIPLDSVAKATVETTGGNSRRMVLILRSGEPILLSSYSSQGGQYQAVQAINDFLGVH